jgi:hypothetical protein
MGLLSRSSGESHQLNPNTCRNNQIGQGKKLNIRDKAKWTYFGNPFLNVALRQAKSLKDAFVVARALVKKRELRERFEPSNPLMTGGENVQPLLIARP